MEEKGLAQNAQYWGNVVKSADLLLCLLGPYENQQDMVLVKNLLPPLREFVHKGPSYLSRKPSYTSHYSGEYHSPSRQPKASYEMESNWTQVDNWTIQVPLHNGRVATCVAVNTLEGINELLEQIKRTKYVAIDCEFLGTKKNLPELKLLQIAVSDTLGYAVQVDILGFDILNEKLRPVLEDNNIHWVGWSLRSDMLAIEQFFKTIDPAYFLDLQVKLRAIAVEELSLHAAMTKYASEWEGIDEFQKIKQFSDSFRFLDKDCVWLLNPLPPKALVYSVFDVLSVFALNESTESYASEPKHFWPRSLESTLSVKALYRWQNQRHKAVSYSPTPASPRNETRTTHRRKDKKAMINLPVPVSPQPETDDGYDDNDPRFSLDVQKAIALSLHEITKNGQSSRIDNGKTSGSNREETAVEGEKRDRVVCDLSDNVKSNILGAEFNDLSDRNESIVHDTKEEHEEPKRGNEKLKQESMRNLNAESTERLTQSEKEIANPLWQSHAKVHSSWNTNASWDKKDKESWDTKDIPPCDIKDATPWDAKEASVNWRNPSVDKRAQWGTLEKTNSSDKIGTRNSKWKAVSSWEASTERYAWRSSAGSKWKKPEEIRPSSTQPTPSSPHQKHTTPSSPHQKHTTPSSPYQKHATHTNNDNRKNKPTFDTNRCNSNTSTRSSPMISSQNTKGLSAFACKPEKGPDRSMRSYSNSSQTASFTWFDDSNSKEMSAASWSSFATSSNDKWEKGIDTDLDEIEKAPKVAPQGASKRLDTTVASHGSHMMSGSVGNSDTGKMHPNQTEVVDNWTAQEVVPDTMEMRINQIPIRKTFTGPRVLNPDIRIRAVAVNLKQTKPKAVSEQRLEDSPTYMDGVYVSGDYDIEDVMVHSVMEASHLNSIRIPTVPFIVAVCFHLAEIKSGVLVLKALQLFIKPENESTGESYTVLLEKACFQHGASRDTNFGKLLTDPFIYRLAWYPEFIEKQMYQKLGYVMGPCLDLVYKANSDEDRNLYNFAEAVEHYLKDWKDLELFFEAKKDYDNALYSKKFSVLYKAMLHMLYIEPQKTLESQIEIASGKKALSRRNNSLTHEEKSILSKANQPKERIIAGRVYHDVESSSYMLPKDDKEIDRLHQEHFVTKELLGFNIMKDALKLLDFQNNQLNVLDVCCGPATWLCETSLEYPNCQFAGIDMCSLWPQIIRPVNLNFTEANVLQGIPYPDKSFDFIQMRFIVLAFKPNEWSFVFSEIKRVLKDGGLFQCIDLDMRISTTNPIAKSYTEAFQAFCSSIGLDASLGAKLDIMLTEKSEMKIIQSEYREVPLGWGGPIGDAYLQIFQDTLDGIEPWLKQSLHVVDDQHYQTLINRTKHAFVQSKAFMGLYAFLVLKPH
ncbi:hypothetical protein CU098_004470 [Rhizopus stolonifer]|uniref:Methyltransferase domain-containing protein n=1 Tax=Rhizopus stolonifer TaxID=4846 RepID=A0A367KL28_RHIST|nr:hypothetical protein CU098_004470 [Rhizopus stolonifer]